MVLNHLVNAPDRQQLRPRSGMALLATSLAATDFAPIRRLETWAVAGGRHPAPGSYVLSDGLACFRAVTAANCHHKAVVTGGKHPNDLPQFRWINTLLGNLKTSFSGTFHAFNFAKYARRYLGGYCFRFNRRFSMAGMTEGIANAVCCCMPLAERDLRDAEAYGQ